MENAAPIKVTNDAFNKKLKAIIDNYCYGIPYFIIHKPSGMVYFIHNKNVDHETITFATFHEYCKGINNRGYTTKHEVDTYVIFMPSTIPIFHKDKLVSLFISL